MIVLPKGSHLNGHTDHGLFIHPQTQTLELHAISTKLKSRRWGGGGGGEGGGELRVVVPFGSPNADTISDQRQIRNTLSWFP